MLAALFMTSMINSHAQQTASVGKTVKEIVKKHEDSKGVTCMTVAKGSGLEMVKMMFNQEFDVSKEKQFADNDFIRCFASASEDKTISDVVIRTNVEPWSKYLAKQDAKQAKRDAKGKKKIYVEDMM